MTFARIMVTGGAGFIGSALCRHLITDTPAHVLNVDKLTYAGNLRSLHAVADHPRYAFARADIGDAEAMGRLFATFRPDAVMHLAAETHVDRSISGAWAFIDSNIVGTFTLLEAARRYRDGLAGEASDRFRLLQVSTDEVYGSVEAGQTAEHSRYDPSSPYSASKAAADHLAAAWGRTYGLPVVISYSANNYGPFHYPEKLIPLAILNAVEGLPVPIYGDGAHVRDWLYVDDHVRALVTILERGRAGDRYNVSGASERQNIAVLEAVCALLDDLRPVGRPHARLITPVADRPGHDRRYALDAGKLARELGWAPQETFESGLAKTVRWFLDHEEWWRPLRAARQEA